MDADPEDDNNDLLEQGAHGGPQISKDPFQILLIRENILQHLDVHDFAAFRGVCRLWNEIGTPFFIRLLGEKEVCLRDRSDVTTVVERLENSYIHFQTYYFIEVFLASSKVEKLLNVTGSNITVLKLFYDKPQQSLDSNDRNSDSECDDNDDCHHLNKSFSDDDSLNSWESIESLSSTSSDISSSVPHFAITPQLLQKLLCKQCPNLKRLTLGNLPYHVKVSESLGAKVPADGLSITHISIRQDHRTAKYSFKFLKDLFCSCPRLKKVRLETNYHSFQQDKILLEALHCSGRMQDLKSLELNSLSAFIFREFLFPHLRDSKNIENIKIKQFDSHLLQPLEFEVFLSSISSSLKTFDIGTGSFAGPRVNFCVLIPELRNLKNLSICLRGGGTTFRQLNYLSQFPYLEKLDLQFEIFANFVNSWNELFSPNQPVHKTLKELALPTGINSSTIIGNIGKIFPNVVKLKMAAQTESALRRIWTAWPRLQELSLCVNPERLLNVPLEENMGLDSLLTGIPTPVCLELKTSKNLKTVTLENIRIHPSIADLKYLKRLIIHPGPTLNTLSGHRNRDEMISDVSGMFALNKLTSMEYMHIGLGVDELSPQCVEDVCEQLNLFYGKVLGGTIFTKQQLDNSVPAKLPKWYATSREFSFY